MKKSITQRKRKLNIFSPDSLKLSLLAVLFSTVISVNAQSRKYMMIATTGTITTTTSSTTVTGTGSSFTTELAPGNSLYNVGTYIGTISSITSNTSLTLLANAAIAVTSGAYFYSEFTGTDQTILACWIKNYLDNHHWDYVMQHISPCPADPDCVTGDVRQLIHTSTNFLPWHRYFIGQLEDKLYLTGLNQFVPLPDWNPSTPIPDPFFNGPCAQANSIPLHSGWDPLPPMGSQDINNVFPYPGAAKIFWDGFSATPSTTLCNFASRAALAAAMGPTSGPHGAVHVAAQNGASFHQAPGSCWFYIWHAYVDDMWRKWECTCSSANPQITYADLYMKDRNTDQNIPMSDGLDMGNEPFVTTQPFWVSEDIWVRNQPDGLTTDVHENPIAQFGIPVYVYVRIRNRSCTDYPGGGTLDLRWAKAASALSWPSPWDNSQTCNGGPSMGDLVPSSATQTIPAIVKGGETIMQFPWYPPNPSDYNSCNTEPWHFCLLARIVDPNDPMHIPETTDLGANVLNNNNIVWKNLTVVDMIPWMVVHQDDCSKDMLAGGVIAVGNPNNTIDKFNINFKLPDNMGDKTPITEEAEVKMILDDETWNKWDAAGFAQQNIRIRNNDCKEIEVIGNPARLIGLKYGPFERGTMNVTFNFLTNHATATREFDYHVVQTRTDGGAIIGGEQYHIVKHDRLPFLANAGGDQHIARGETATLEAEDIGEDAIYNWYVVGGDRIASERVIQVAPHINTEYEVEVISRSDGFKCYDRVNIFIKPFAITSVSPNPAGEEVTVNYYVQQASTAQLVIMQPYGVEKTYDLNTNQSAITVNLADYASGLYNIILICNGDAADVKTFVKE